MDNDKITTIQIKDAISWSGYLIEQRVSRILAENYFVKPNYTYLDPLSGITREIDMRVDSSMMWAEDDKNAEGIHWSLFCECENNSQPVVFFPFTPIDPTWGYSVIKCFGMPMKIMKNNEYVHLLSFLPFDKYHHYCKGDVSSQYCSFTHKRDKEKWMATHLEEQHDTFNSLIYAVEYETNKFYSDNWEPPSKDEVEPIFFEFIYPLVILGGELLEAKIGKRGLVLKKAHHVQFLKNTYISGSEVTYKIDVVTEDYVSEYMKIIEFEIAKLKNAIKRHKKIITDSIPYILQDVKKADKPNSYKKLLTVDEMD